MGTIGLILFALFVMVALGLVVLMLVRESKNHKKWKELEPQLINDIEKMVKQKIVFKTMQNASYSMEFRGGEGFWLWMAFTADYAIFVRRDEIAENGEGHLFVSRRKDVSMVCLQKHYVELEVKNKDTSEVQKLILCMGESYYAELSRFIPAKSGSRSR